MALDQPLVTALINTYNYGRYLPLAINSVLNQTYENIEIIVVDDGSTDDTSQVLERYRDRVRVIRTENGGQGHAFNVGIPAARGELIMLLDADDLWTRDKVARMVELAAHHPEAGLLYHRFINVDAYGNQLSEPLPHILIEGDYRKNYMRSGGSYWAPVTSVLTLRTAVVRKFAPIFAYAVREGADTVLTDYCMMQTKVAASPDALAMRVLHGKNLYATGRDSEVRTRATRESDVRRVEWRNFAVRTAFIRTGRNLRVSVDRNEWRMINLYWLGKASFWKLARAILLCREHDLRSRINRLKWARRVRRHGYADEPR
jgi:glycosyltransferase involved in cell wall biosynthesis